MTQSSGSAVVTDSYIKSSIHLSTGSMYFVLPGDGVSVEDLLQEDTLWEIFENNDYTDAQIQWSIPKFETDTMADYADTLKAMGLTDAFFDGSPDFSGIADSALYLSQALQAPIFPSMSRGSRPPALLRWKVSLPPHRMMIRRSLK